MIGTLNSSEQQNPRKEINFCRLCGVSFGILKGSERQNISVTVPNSYGVKPTSQFAINNTWINAMMWVISTPQTRYVTYGNRCFDKAVATLLHTIFREGNK